jgi:hypothetical protein
MSGSDTLTQVIKGLGEASQLPGIQYAQLPRSSPKGTASLTRHACHYLVTAAGSLHPSRSTGRHQAPKDNRPEHKPPTFLYTTTQSVTIVTDRHDPSSYLDGPTYSIQSP